MIEESRGLSRPLFVLGQIVATPGALGFLEERRIAPQVLLQRHLSGDWAEMDDFDQEANRQAVKDGSRILSSFGFAGEKIWIITEADRSSTCFLLPSEY